MPVCYSPAVCLSHFHSLTPWKPKCFRLCCLVLPRHLAASATFALVPDLHEWAERPQDDGRAGHDGNRSGHFPLLGFKKKAEKKEMILPRKTFCLILTCVATFDAPIPWNDSNRYIRIKLLSLTILKKVSVITHALTFGRQAWVFVHFKLLLSLYVLN